MIIIKSEEEIKKMQASGQRLNKVMDELIKMTQPGISTAQINEKALELVRKSGSKPAFLGYHGFPGAVCTSINEEVVHGIPSPERIIQGGDLVKLDIGLIYEEYFSDMARTIIVGEVSAETRKLVEVTQQALHKGIKKAQVGGAIGDIGQAVQKHVEKHGFSVVTEMVGHGIGLDLHEDPAVPNHGHKNTGPRLEAGMTLAIEPMVNIGNGKINIDKKDGWTVRTADGSLSAHFENTIAITDKGPKILTN